MMFLGADGVGLQSEDSSKWGKEVLKSGFI